MAAALANLILQHDFQDGELLNIVAHSHGGNVVKIYSGLNDSRFIDNLATLGTPHAGMFQDYHIQRENVGTYLNAYSTHDFVVPRAGGGDGHVLDITKHAPAASTDPNALNVDASVTMGTRKHGRNGIPKVAIGHGDLVSPGVWKQHIDPTLNRTIGN